jgi:hypothetical protein
MLGTWIYRMIYQTALRFSITSLQVVNNNISFKYMGSRRGGGHCATSRKVPGSIPDGAIGIFH